MSSDFEFSKPGSSRGKVHRHHHHHKGSSRRSGRSGGGRQISLMSDEEEVYSPEAAGHSIAKWRHEAHVKDHEIKILRQMVQNAKTEIQKKEQTVAKMVERMPAFQNENQGFSKDALDMIETLERKLSEREYQTLKVQQDLESAQAAVTERNERIHDLCLQWEKSTSLLKEARERDLAELQKQIRHLEEEVIPPIRSRAEAAEAREKQMKNELTVAHARIKQIEALAQEKLAQKERQLAESTRRIRELELDLEHVMAAAARYTRREVLVEHLGGHLQNTLTASTPVYQDLPSVPIVQQPSPAGAMASPSMYTPAPNVYQQIGTDAYGGTAPPPSSSHAPYSHAPYGQEPALAQMPPVPPAVAPPVAPPPPVPPVPPVPPASAMKSQTRPSPSKSVSFAPPTPAAPAAPAPAPAPPLPPQVVPPAAMPQARPQEVVSGPPSNKASTSSAGAGDPPHKRQDSMTSPKPPPLPGQDSSPYSNPMMPPDPELLKQQPRHKFSFQEHIPENSPRHRLSVIMRKLKDPTSHLRTSSGSSPVKAT
ncbi:hypothetical protein HOP50_02g11530 [Chloropicon primus]|uniref:Uncharacterized protein n=1 Tax=Chloropicon primus TaxID=1764295 RepID=A0A5B8MH15_9CHLO|nr:hypothetical protein A3770_02p11680 [Chloropicon primus]UPQ97858.1 hypothetical protein HOP50_02g11530 [Chloropicon primus]|eukprot:QDZ18650.1 hypothetical protein A3770_02p11680 [Chloropicon primus]